MTYDPVNGADRGTVYFDNLRLVKKDIDYTIIDIQDSKIAKKILVRSKLSKSI